MSIIFINIQSPVVQYFGDLLKELKLRQINILIVFFREPSLFAVAKLLETGDVNLMRVQVMKTIEL